MSFLALSTADLEASLTKELQENPALELVDEVRCPQCGRRITTPPCQTCVGRADGSDTVVYVSPRDASRIWTPDDDDRTDFPEIGTPERLDEHILRQVGPALSIEERRVAAYILARLDDHGLLPESAAEVAAYTHARLSLVERVLDLIQHADPPGVGAASPLASLLVQLDALVETTPASTLALCRAVLESHFELLARFEYGRIARRLRVPRSAVEAAARFIQRNLTPHPALAFWGEGRAQRSPDANTYNNPDVTIARQPRSEGEMLMVEVYTPLSGWLRVNPEFRAALSQCEDGERDKWSAAVERATLVTKCIQQRNHTMRRLMEILAATQRSFILGGDADLKPLTRARVARELSVHESTISRAVAGKCVALPGGRIVPLAKFFDRSLSVRDRVRVLVESESRPLTDDQIAGALEQQGIKIARRTVAKYRNMLGILPANVRGRLARHRPLQPSAAAA